MQIMFNRIKELKLKSVWKGPKHRNLCMPRLFFLIFSKTFRTQKRIKYENVRPFPLRLLTWMGLLFISCIKKYFPGGIQDHLYKPEMFWNIDTFLMVMKMKWVQKNTHPAQNAEGPQKHYFSILLKMFPTKTLLQQAVPSGNLK